MYNTKVSSVKTVINFKKGVNILSLYGQKLK